MGFKFRYWFRIVCYSFIISYVLHLTWILFKLAVFGDVLVYEYITWVALTETAIGFICLIVLLIDIYKMIKSYVQLVV